MNKHVLTTALIGLACTALMTTAAYWVAGVNLALLFAAFFGGVSGAATVIDYLDHRAAEAKERKPLAVVDLDQHGLVDTPDEDVPEGLRAVLDPHGDGSVRDGDPLADIFKHVTKMMEEGATSGAVSAVYDEETGDFQIERIEMNRRPRLSEDELKEVEEKWSP